MAKITLEELKILTDTSESDVCFPYFKIMPDGHFAFLHRLAFTWGLHLGADHFTMYHYRFCFPSLTDAIKAFNEADNLHYVPDFGWVAARPEGRLPLPKHLVGVDYVNKTIDQLIDMKAYNQTFFDKWLKQSNMTLAQCDAGAQQFYANLSR